jgi:protein TonB
VLSVLVHAVLAWAIVALAPPPCGRAAAPAEVVVEVTLAAAASPPQASPAPEAREALPSTPPGVGARAQIDEQARARARFAGRDARVVLEHPGEPRHEGGASAIGDLDGGSPDGGGVPDAALGAADASPQAPPLATVPFGEGMTRPRLIAGEAEPTYTREALAAKVEGTVMVRCTLTVDGTLTGCRILKGLPFLEGAVTSTLARQRYTPVMFQGRPQSVYYTLTFRFRLR